MCQTKKAQTECCLRQPRHVYLHELICLADHWVVFWVSDKLLHRGEHMCVDILVVRDGGFVGVAESIGGDRHLMEHAILVLPDPVCTVKVGVWRELPHKEHHWISVAAKPYEDGAEVIGVARPVILRYVFNIGASPSLRQSHTFSPTYYRLGEYIPEAGEAMDHFLRILQGHDSALLTRFAGWVLAVCLALCSPKMMSRLVKAEI